MATLLGILLSNAAVATILAVLALAAHHLCSRPAVRHSLWLLVLLKLITPPIWTVPIHLPAATPPNPPRVESILPSITEIPSVADELPVNISEPLAAVDSTTTLPDAVQSPAPIPITEPPHSAAAVQSPPILWSRLATHAAALLWLGGSVFCLAIILTRIRRFDRLLRFATPAHPSLQSEAVALAKHLGLPSCPGVWMVPGAVSPMLIAMGGPARLLLPQQLWHRLDPDQRQTLLVHELAHLRRRDHWIRFIEITVTVLYWWLPVAWFARRQMREAEEQCCDAWVLWAMPHAARDYAAAVVEAVDFASTAGPVLPALASGMGQFIHLKRRLIMIKQGNVARSLGWTGFSIVCGLAAMLLPVVPTLGQASSEASAPTAAPADPQPAPIQTPTIELKSPTTDPKRVPFSIVLTAPEIQEVTAVNAADPTAEAQVTATEAQIAADEESLAAAQAQLDHARAEVEKMAAELHAAQQRLKAMQAQLGAQMRQRARERLDPFNKMPPATEGRAQPGAANRPPRATPGRHPPVAPMPPNAGIATMPPAVTLPVQPRHLDREDRLNALEAKLSALLEEVRSLKQDPRPEPGLQTR